jgi:hypothetical protein
LPLSPPSRLLRRAQSVLDLPTSLTLPTPSCFLPPVDQARRVRLDPATSPPLTPPSRSSAEGPSGPAHLHHQLHLHLLPLNISADTRSCRHHLHHLPARARRDRAASSSPAHQRGHPDTSTTFPLEHVETRPPHHHPPTSTDTRSPPPPFHSSTSRPGRLIITRPPARTPGHLHHLPARAR